MRMGHRLLAAGVGLACAGTGTAQAQGDGNGWYFGVGGGATDWSGDLPGQIQGAYAGFAGADLLEARLTDHSDAAAQAIAGYRFNPWFSLELGWQDLGEASSVYRVHATGPVLGPGIGSIDGRYRARDFNAAAVASWPLAERFALLARAGVAATRLKYDESGTQTNGHPYAFHASASHTGALAGLGAEWHFAPAWSVRFAVDRVFNVGNRFALDADSNGRFDHVDAWTVNLFWNL